MIYDKSKKRYFYGRNKGISLKKDAIHPNLLEGTPSPRSIAATLYFNYDIYNCAEIDALNQALHSGSKMANLEVYTTHYGGKKHLMPKPSCPLCTMLLRGEIAANYSGWQEREFPHE